MVICLERADPLGVWYMMFTCIFVNFPYGVQGHVLYLIVSIPDLCLLPFFLNYAHLVFLVLVVAFRMVNQTVKEVKVT